MTTSFGRYQVLSEVGRGGMGIVYKALDRETQEIVAVKHLVAENVGKEKEHEFRDRFKREAATAQRLSHPNIVKVYEVSTVGDNYYYVMEFLDGHNLHREIELSGGKLKPAQYWPILSQITEALSFAHSMNVVHRDVKPDNIFLLKDGTVKITDFGIARAAEYEQTHLTKTGIMMGTLAYVSPEQLQDAKNVDHRADIFSLGVVSYEILSGCAPFAGEGIAQIVVKIVSEQEKPLHLIEPNVRVEISAAIAKAMRKHARDRYRTIKDFARDYENALKVPYKGSEELKPFSSYFSSSDSIQGIHSALSQDTIGQVTGQMIPNTVTDGVSGLDLLHLPQPENMEVVPTFIGTGGLDTDTDFIKTYKSVNNSVKIQSPHTHAQSSIFRLLHMITICGGDSSGLIEPAALCCRSNGVVVADSATRKVHLFSQDGRWTGELKIRQDGRSPSTTGGAISKPSGIAIDTKGRIYICDSSDHFVRMFDTSGVFLREFQNIQGSEGGLAGIAVDSTGTVFASDPGNGVIQVFQPELGLWLRSIGSKGKAELEFQLPAGLAVDRLNRIYCADYGTSRIYIFSKNGSLIRSFGGRGTGNGLFNLPRHVAVDKNDKIYVLDSLNHRIQVFGPTGDWIDTFGGRGTEPGKFIGPSDLSIDNANNVLYVADRNNHRIQVFAL